MGIFYLLLRNDFKLSTTDRAWIVENMAVLTTVINRQKMII